MMGMKDFFICNILVNTQFIMKIRWYKGFHFTLLHTDTHIHRMLKNRKLFKVRHYLIKGRSVKIPTPPGYKNVFISELLKTSKIHFLYVPKILISFYMIVVLNIAVENSPFGFGFFGWGMPRNSLYSGVILGWRFRGLYTPSPQNRTEARFIYWQPLNKKENQKVDFSIVIPSFTLLSCS